MKGHSLPGDITYPQFVEIHNLRDAGGVRRYHTDVHMPSQSVAEHSWNMAMMCRILWPADLFVMMACLTHDIAEYWTGDVPSPAKWRWPELRDQLAMAEAEIIEEHGARMPLDDLQKTRLRFLDLLELAWYSAECYAEGNRYARVIYQKVIAAVKDLCPDEALGLVMALEDFVGGFDGLP